MFWLILSQIVGFIIVYLYTVSKKKKSIKNSLNSDITIQKKEINGEIWVEAFQVMAFAGGLGALPLFHDISLATIMTLGFVPAGLAFFRLLMTSIKVLSGQDLSHKGEKKLSQDLPTTESFIDVTGNKSFSMLTLAMYMALLIYFSAFGIVIYKSHL